MKKDVIELVSVTVKINGEEKTFIKENCDFQGWEIKDDDNFYYDSGVELHLTDGKKMYKLDV